MQCVQYLDLLVKCIRFFDYNPNALVSNLGIYKHFGIPNIRGIEVEVFDHLLHTRNIEHAKNNVIAARLRCNGCLKAVFVLQ